MSNVLLRARLFRVIGGAIVAAALAACGGGGGGSSMVGGGGGGGAPASVSGDMLALAPSRGWNYQGSSSSGSFTITAYADPAPVNGATALSAAAVQGTVPTVLTSGANFDASLVGIGGFNPVTGGGYTAAYEVSAGSSAALPNPTLVPGTLTQGQTFSPYAGVTATVTSVGTVPGASACPTPANGAVVAYNVNGQTYTVTYVPGCGITQFIYPSGATYTLVSVATYASIGQLGSARVVRSVNWVSTVRSILGLEHNVMPGAHLRL